MTGQPVANTKIKLLYIAGLGKSGSTLLGRVLEQIEGFVYVGELMAIWDKASQEHYLCSCGLELLECDFWKSVLQVARDTIDIAAVRAARVPRRPVNRRDLPVLLLPGGRRTLATRWAAFAAQQVRLYEGVQRVTCSRVIVDSSHSALYGLMLSMWPELDVYIVHLVRDPRGISNSSINSAKRKSKSGKIRRFKRWAIPFRSLVWTWINVICEILWQREPERYLSLRYEDFVADPHAALNRILSMLGETANLGSLIRDHSVEIGRNHICSGNGNRFTTGIVHLVLDDKWKRSLDWLSKTIILFLNWPWMLRYRYLGK